MSTGYIPDEFGWLKQNSYFQGWLRVKYSTSYNPSTNKSTVTLTPQFWSNAPLGNDYRLFDGTGSGNGGVYANGAKLYAFGTNYGYGNYLSCGDAYYTWADLNSSFSFQVSHDSNGDATFTAGVYGSVLTMYSSGLTWEQRTLSPIGATASSTVTIHENAASSIAQCTSSVATGGKISVVMNKLTATNYHVAKFKIGSTVLDTSSSFDATLNYTAKAAWFNSYPNASSLTVTASVQTYNSGGTAIGSPATATVTVNAGTNMAPTLTTDWVTLAAYNTGTAASGISGYVKGYSKSEATFDGIKVTTKNNATIASYSITCQGTTVSTSPYRTPTLKATSVDVVCTVTDSRGLTASETKTLDIMDYAKPKLTGISVFRCDSSQQADESGTHISAKAKQTYSSLDGQNTCTLTAAIAASGGSYGTATTLADNTATRLGPVSADASYTVRIRATDSLNNKATYYAAVPTQKWAMKFRANGTGVAFGKAAETDNVFEVSSDWAVKLGQPLAITSGGTGAATAAQARDNLGALAADKLVTVEQMAANTNYSFTLENGTRFLFFTASANDTAKTLYIYNVGNSDGAVSGYAVKSGSAVTLTNGTNLLTVRSSVTGAMGFLVFRGSVVLNS